MKKKLTLMAAMAAFITVAHAQWQLTGNSISGTDFLGSTNAQPLVFKANNVRAGFIDFDSTRLNTSIGWQGLLSITSGTNNSAFGYRALRFNTTGGGNVAVGALALTANTTGAHNQAIGMIAMPNNTSGAFNTAVGSAALWANTTGQRNVAIGFGAADNNTTANDNSAFGYKALFTNQTGTRNVAVGMHALYSATVDNLTAIGYQALNFNTTGTGSTAAGFEALYGNTTGTNNTSVGYQSLYTNNTGFENVAVGYQALYANAAAEYNTAVGFSALYFNQTGESNTALGNRALYSNSGTSPHRNTAVGDGALYSNISGANNTAVGVTALFNNISGSQNTALGYQADVTSSALTNATVLGYGASANGSNMVRVGNTSVTSIGGYANWSNLSDQRFKKNVKENVPGLSFINQLRPVTYTLDITGIEKFLHPEPRKDYNGREMEQADKAAIAQKEKIVYTGFMAQEVEMLAKKLGYEFSGVDAAKTDKELYALRYAEFVVPLVKSVQELSRLNDSLVSIIGELQEQVNELRIRMGNPSGFKTGFLRQNVPNPSLGNTVIEYFVPEMTANAQLVLSDMSGKLLRQVTIGNRGMGQLSLSVSAYPSGTYVYTLFVDGKKVDSKQLILTK